MKLSIRLIKNSTNNEYIATCPELDISCYATTKHEAIYRIQRIVSFYIQSAQELGYEVENFETIDIDGTHYLFNHINYPSTNSTRH